MLKRKRVFFRSRHSMICCSIFQENLRRLFQHQSSVDEFSQWCDQALRGINNASTVDSKQIRFLHSDAAAILIEFFPGEATRLCFKTNFLFASAV